MIHVVNYASKGFELPRRLQNGWWSLLPGTENVTVHSFSRPDVFPILRDLQLDNDDDVRAVLQQPRGDGLWAWKAILTLHVYRNVAREGDIVFYMDSSACPVRPFGGIWQHIRDHGHFFVRVSALENVARVRRWLAGQRHMKAKAGLLDGLDFSSRLWTKPFPSAPGNEHGLPACVLERLSGALAAPAGTYEQLVEMEQVCGGFQGYLKREGNDRVLADLVSCVSPEFFDDEVRGEAPGRYIDHRHDQSMLSLIVNAECLRNPGFAMGVVDRLPEVWLHRARTRRLSHLARRTVGAFTRMLSL